MTLEFAGANPVLEAALAWRRAGFSVVPIEPDGSKRPHGAWKDYQHAPASEGTITGWFAAGRFGLGVVMGAVSGNAEMLEIEGRGSDSLSDLEQLALASGLAEPWRRVTRTYCERSPSGGYHWLYRVEGAPVPGNTKLARRPATPEELAAKPEERVKVLVETRGEGGQVVVAPTPGTFHPTGRPWALLAGAPGEVPVITADEREALHALVATLDETPRAEAAPERPAGDGGPATGRPGDDFEARTPWAQILEPHGWTFVYEDRAGTRYWRRPGKDLGVSATTGHAKDRDRLYVFTSSTDFAQEKPYTKFAAYAVLNHGGDHAAAARALGAAGFGDRTQPRSDDASPLPSLELPDDERRAVESFWSERVELAHVRDFARARRCSPWALLGVVLGHAVAAVPPHVVLPPIVGSAASLNLFCALVGPSGAGKGAAESAALEAVDHGSKVETFAPGSGEGLTTLFARRVRQSKEDGGGWSTKRIRDAVVLSAPEVDALVALGGRQGATLLPQLRQAWSGEALGFAYSDPEKALRVERHSYRLALVVGVQPGRAAPLLDDADGGTPQRFLWLPVVDAEAPDVAPACPAPIMRYNRWHGVPGGLFETFRPRTLQHMSVPDVARTEIDAARLARLRGEQAALDGHALLGRLKVAAALGILTGRDYVDADDWRLAGVVMAVSDRTRASISEHLRREAERRDEAIGRSDGRRAVVAAQTADDAAVSRVCQVIRRGLARRPGEALTRNAVLRLAASRDRGYGDEALERLVAVGDVAVDATDPESPRYSWAGA